MILKAIIRWLTHNSRHFLPQSIRKINTFQKSQCKSQIRTHAASFNKFTVYISSSFDARSDSLLQQKKLYKWKEKDSESFWRNHQVDETISKQWKWNSYTTLIASYLLFIFYIHYLNYLNAMRKYEVPDIGPLNIKPTHTYKVK